MTTTEMPEALRADSMLEGSVSPESSPSDVSAWILNCWWIAFAASSIAVVSGHLLIKAGLNAASASPIGTTFFMRVMHEILQPQLLGGLAIYIVGTVCWMRAVSQKEISFLYPLSSVNYVVVTAISAVAFHEALSGRRIAGVALIVLGMILMIRQPGRKAI